MSVTLGVTAHIFKKRKASFFLRAFGCASLQQLPLITAGWVRAEQSGLHAFPPILWAHLQNVESANEIPLPIRLAAQAKHGPLGLASSSWVLT